MLRLELLEPRHLLAGDLLSGWHNTAKPADVNADLSVTPLDALILANEIRRAGPRVLDEQPEAPRMYLDVDRDGALTEDDFLAVVRYVDRHRRAATVAEAAKLWHDALDGPALRGGVEQFDAAVREAFATSALVQGAVAPPAASESTYDPEPASGSDGDCGCELLYQTENPDPDNAAPSIWPEVGGLVTVAFESSTADQVISFSVTADDADLPDETLTFLDPVVTSNAGTGPANQPTVTPSGETSAEFSWAVAETDGPATYNVTLAVEDAAGARAEATFRVAVAVGAPSVSIGPTMVEEGQIARFTVALSKPARETITVEYQTIDGTAVAGEDYTASSGTVTFSAGESSRIIEVPTLDDAIHEDDETFEVMLQYVENAVLGNVSATATIVDNDVAGGGWLVYGEAAVSESPDGSVTIELGVADRAEEDTQPSAVHGASLLLAPATSYTLEYDADLATWDSYNEDTGEPGTGYWDSFSIGVTDSPYPELVLDDPLSFPFVWGGTEWGDGILENYSAGGQSLTLAGNPSGPNYLNVVLDTQTEGEADDLYPSWGTFILTEIPQAGPEFSIESYTVTEHGATAYFVVRRTGDLSGAASVGYATADGTATAGEDYVGASGTLTFADGDPVQIIEIPVLNDRLEEGDEAFTVTLTNPSPGGTILAGEATGTIADDDPEPVGPLIDPPVACDDTYDEQGQFLYSVSPGEILYADVSLGQNDIVYGYEQTYEVVSGPSHGTLTLDSWTGEFTYEPEPDFEGVDQFWYKFTDTSLEHYYAFTFGTGQLASNSALVLIAVAPVQVDLDIDSDNNGYINTAKNLERQQAEDAMEASTAKPITFFGPDSPHPDQNRYIPIRLSIPDPGGGGYRWSIHYTKNIRVYEESNGQYQPVAWNYKWPLPAGGLDQEYWVKAVGAGPTGFKSGFDKIHLVLWKANGTSYTERGRDTVSLKVQDNTQVSQWVVPNDWTIAAGGMKTPMPVAGAMGPQKEWTGKKYNGYNNGDAYTRQAVHGSFSLSFDVELDRRFVQPDTSGDEQISDADAHKLSFVANSGVKIGQPAGTRYYEVAILDVVKWVDELAGGLDKFGKADA